MLKTLCLPLLPSFMQCKVSFSLDSSKILYLILLNSWIVFYNLIQKILRIIVISYFVRYKSLSHFPPLHS